MSRPPSADVEVFWAHLAVCEQCRTDSTRLCRIGALVLSHASASTTGRHLVDVRQAAAQGRAD